MALRSLCILVFAKAPVAGEVKTRLIPALGAAGAANLYRAMARHCISTAVTAFHGAVELWCSPDVHHVFFEESRTKWNLTSRPQGPGDIGARMSAAMRSALEGAEAVLLMGTDVPALTAADIGAAAAALSGGCDAVFVPTADGGYGLIGLRRHDPRLFDGIAWSTPAVMAQTRDRLRLLGWRWVELPPRWDVDDKADLDRLHADANLAYLLRETA